MDKLRAIRFFCRVAEARSFVAAAHDLDVAPSVLSKAIAALEAEIKYRLFNRTTRRVSLTQSGARYYDQCKRLVMELDETELAMRDSIARPAGRVMAGLHPAINRLVMARIDQFLKAYPEVTVETTVTSSASSLIEDQLDVLIALGNLPNSDYAARRLGTTELVIVASPGYLKERGIPATPADLSHHSIVLSGRRDGPSYMRWTMKRGAQVETVFVRSSVVIRQGVHMHEACLSGAGMGRLLDFAVHSQIADGTLKRVLPAWSFGEMPIHALYPDRRSVPAKVRAFVHFVRESIRDRS